MRKIWQAETWSFGKPVIGTDSFKTASSAKNTSTESTGNHIFPHVFPMIFPIYCDFLWNIDVFRPDELERVGTLDDSRQVHGLHGIHGRRGKTGKTGKTGPRSSEVIEVPLRGSTRGKMNRRSGEVGEMRCEMRWRPRYRWSQMRSQMSSMSHDESMASWAAAFTPGYICYTRWLAQSRFFKRCSSRSSHSSFPEIVERGKEGFCSWLRAIVSVADTKHQIGTTFFVFCGWYKHFTESYFAVWGWVPKSVKHITTIGRTDELGAKSVFAFAWHLQPTGQSVFLTRACWIYLGGGFHLFMLIVFHPNIWKQVPNTDFYNFSLRLEPPCSDGLVKIWLKSTWDGPCFPFCFSHLTWAAKTFQEKDLQSTNWIKLSSTGLPMRKTTVNTQPQRVWLMVRVILKLPANCSRRGREHSNWFVRTFRTCCDLLCYRWLYLQTL